MEAWTALAADNTIVLKPDERTALTRLELTKSAERAGLPKCALNIVTGAGEEVEARLAAHTDVRKIAFTGSTAAGREITKLAAENIKGHTRTRGQGPNIVFPDADIDSAVDGALVACFLYAGQACEQEGATLAFGGVPLEGRGHNPHRE